jgi:3-methyladenine DNA glycosylase AlkD
VTERISCAAILTSLKSLARPENIAGMARYGINPHRTYGVSMPVLRQLAREIGKDHRLAAGLWSSGIHEARILATLVDDPALVTEDQMDRWVDDLDSWDVCDQCCNNLFSRTLMAYRKAVEWSTAQKEFIKRAGFVLMATLAVRDKKASDGQFELFFTNIRAGATDNRNFVKKAVNWALRQIGKRNLNLNRKAIKTAEHIRQIDSASARWIAADALRELTDPAVQKRLKGQS